MKTVKLNIGIKVELNDRDEMIILSSPYDEEDAFQDVTIDTYVANERRKVFSDMFRGMYD